MNAARRRGRSQGTVAWRAALAALGLTMTASAFAYAPSPSSAATRADRRSTGAYLHASFTFDRAVVANHVSASASVAAYVKRVGGECPGVLAGAPIPELLGKHPSFEQAKQVEQESALGGEVLSALLNAWIAPDLAAFKKFASAVSPLRWHDPQIARLVHAEIVEFELLLAPPPDVCADMRAWVASGYRTLPPAASSNALASTDNASGPSLEESLKQFESPAQEGLIRRRKRTLRNLRQQLERVLRSTPGLLRTLGAPETPTEAEPTDLIGRGKTAANTTYTISSTGPAHDCPISLTITEASNGNHATLGECLSPSTAHLGHARLGCNEGHRTIWAPLPPAVRAVSLKLAGGRRIVSRALSIPAKDGGPLGLYYQALPLSSGHPVSLTELDAHGRALAAVPIARTSACKRPRRGESTGSG